MVKLLLKLKTIFVIEKFNLATEWKTFKFNHFKILRPMSSAKTLFSYIKFTADTRLNIIKRYRLKEFGQLLFVYYHNYYTGWFVTSLQYYRIWFSISRTRQECNWTERLETLCFLPNDSYFDVESNKNMGKMTCFKSFQHWDRSH